MKHWILRELLSDAFISGYWKAANPPTAKELEQVSHGIEVNSADTQGILQQALEWADRRIEHLIKGGASEF